LTWNSLAGGRLRSTARVGSHQRLPGSHRRPPPVRRPPPPAV